MAAAPMTLPRPTRRTHASAEDARRYPAASEQAASLWDLRVPHKGRMLTVGMTESGKSTLAERLITMWLQEYGQRARVLIVDSKPRFRARWRLDGWPADYLYKKWAKDHGSQSFPESVLIDLNHIAASLKRIWDQKVPLPAGESSRVAIAQGKLTVLPWLSAAANVAYDLARAGRETLVYYDELADFFGTSGMASRGEPSLQIIRSGREKHVSFLASSQRPKGIPKSALTEMTSAAIFNVAYEEDLKHLQEMGFPEPVDYWRLLRNPHSFYFFNRKHPANRGYYRWEQAQ